MKYFLSSILMLLLVPALAQNPNVFIDSILNNRTLKIPTYHLAKAGNESKFFAMQFGKSEFVDTTGLYVLRNADILSIDLVFTDYPAKLDLKALNKSRFIELSKLLPRAMKNVYTQWQIFRQMDGNTKESAKGMLHGFVINYRLKESIDETVKEIELLKSVTPELIEKKRDDENIKPNAKPNHWALMHDDRKLKYMVYKERLVKGINPDKEKLESLKEKKDSLFSLVTKDALSLKLIDEKEKSMYTKKDSVYVLLYPLPEPDTFLLRRMERSKVLPKEDSTIIKALTRNKFKNMLVVADVTNSMAPFSAQLIQWLSQEGQQNNLRSFVCFNDGDGKQLEYKQIGNTGGIYGAAYKNPVQISELMQETMAKGSGGDFPENVCEAIIKAIDMFKMYDDVVLIADSWAPVRDIELVSKIKKPIKVILCGDFSPQADYVTIAYVTGGSLHFMNDDMVDLSPLNNGGSLIIGGKKYVVQNGKVVVLLK